MRALIEVYNCTLKAVDIHGNSPFHVACANKHQRIVQYFSCLIALLPCTHLNADGDTVLHVACKFGSVPILRIIIHDMFLNHNFVEPLKLNLYQDDVLSREFSANKLKILSPLFEITKLKNDMGYTPIHTACHYGHLGVLQFFFTEVRMSLIVSLLQLVPSLLAIAYMCEHYEIIDYFHTLVADTANACLVPLVKRGSSDILSSFYEKCVDDYGNYISEHKTLCGYYFVNNLGLPRISPLELSISFAARHAKKSLFKHLISQGSFSKVNFDGDTLLHAACVSCDLEVVEMAYANSRGRAHIVNGRGSTCLHTACEWGASLEIIKFLIGKGLSAEVENHKGQTPFHLAIIHERYDLFDYFLSFHDCIDINDATNDGETLLHFATSCSDLSYVKRIIAHPTFNSLNHRDKYGDTPVFNACRTGDIEMLTLIVGHKDCNLLAVNEANETIFTIACRMSNTKILCFLFQKIICYPPKLQNYLGQTLLHIASYMNNLDFVKTLASHDEIYSLSEDINLIDKINELTPLQYACAANDISLLKYLLEVTNCDPDSRNKNGNTVLHICCEKNFVDIARICIEHCSISVRNELGDTPIHVACKHGNHELALILMKELHLKKINDFCNRNGDSVLHIAASKPNAVTILKYLVENQICHYKAKNEFTGNTALHISCLNGVVENALYLFQLEYDEETWYNNNEESPLYLAFEHCTDSFFSSLITAKIVNTWQFQKLVKVRRPYDNEEYTHMPLPHYLIHTSIYS